MTLKYLPLNFGALFVHLTTSILLAKLWKYYTQVHAWHLNLFIYKDIQHKGHLIEANLINRTFDVPHNQLTQTDRLDRSIVAKIFKSCKRVHTQNTYRIPIPGAIQPCLHKPTSNVPYIPKMFYSLRTRKAGWTKPLNQALYPNPRPRPTPSQFPGIGTDTFIHITHTPHTPDKHALFLTNNKADYLCKWYKHN